MGRRAARAALIGERGGRHRVQERTLLDADPPASTAAPPSRIGSAASSSLSWTNTGYLGDQLAWLPSEPGPVAVGGWVGTPARTASSHQSRSRATKLPRRLRGLATRPSVTTNGPHRIGAGAVAPCAGHHRSRRRASRVPAVASTSRACQQRHHQAPPAPVARMPTPRLGDRRGEGSRGCSAGRRPWRPRGRC